MNRLARDPKAVGELLVEAQNALGVSQGQLGDMLGLSRQTIWRYQTGQSNPLASSLQDLARRVRAIDARLAARLAGAGTGARKTGFRIAAPARPTGPGGGAIETRLMADAIVCAAAEALDSSPRTVRRALLAAFARARDTGLALDAIETALARADTQDKSRR
ncbi:MAG TPA: helix-turn-helix domain-containing protein [Polyangiaceae bacterium]|jgi:transcriptional regulator with XRE-family HTH domain|nr:helix-turn-helix domain-containing protein [Polyangiaceae bacterium]